MVQAVGAVSAAVPVRPAATATALEAQLDLCQRKLSDQVNCASSKTPEGKKAIEELTSRIGLLKDRIDQLGKPARTNASSGAARPSSIQSSGGLVDTFA